MTIQMLKQEFLKMSFEEQKEFLQFAANLLPLEEGASAATPDVTPEQEVEILRRFDAIDAGTAVMYSWEDVRKQLKERYGV